MAEGGTAVQGLTILEGEGKTGDGGISSKTVEVRGFSLGISHDVLEMYFENTRRSGGGDIEGIEIKDDVAYITFEEPEVVQRVISHSPHQVAGQTLSVTVFCSPPQKACYENRVLVQRLNSAITEELLTNFLETETGMKVTEFLYGEEEGKVVVTFSDCIDFTALRKGCNTRRLQGTFLQVTKVAISNCIFVKDLQPSASHDVILFYFENKRRSGGGDVERVEMNIAERYCLVYFQDHNVIDTVLCQQHKIDGTDIKVHLHHECLGRRSSRNRLDPFLGMSKPELKENLLKAETSSSISCNHDIGCDFVETPLKAKTSSSISSNPDTGCDFVETPKWQEDDGKNCVLPLWIKYKRASERTVLKDIKKIPCSWNFHLFWNFFTKTKQGQNMLDDILKTCGCSVTVSSDDDDLFIYEISHESFESKSDLIYFIKDTLGKVYACAQQSFFSDIFLIDHRMLEEFLQRLKQTKEMDNAWIELVGEQEPDAICVVCTKKDQEAILQAVTAVRTDVQDCFENHEEVVTIDTMWQKVLRKFGYLQELGKMFPDLTITPEETKSTIMLKGPRDQSKAAADHLMKLLGAANSEVKVEIFSPGCQFEIFSYPEMCCYIDNSIIKLPIVCIPNHMTKKIHLFSKKSEQVMSMDKLIKGCIKERLYPLPKNESVWSPQIVSSLEELKKKNKGKIVINQSPTGLLLTTADDIFESVDTTVQLMFSIETGKVKSLKILDKRCGQSVNKFDNKTSEKQRKTEDSQQSVQDVPSKHKPTYSKCKSEPCGNIGILKTKVQPEIKVKSNSDGIAEMEYRKKSDVQTLKLCSKPLNVEYLQPQEVEFYFPTVKLKKSVRSSNEFAENTMLLETFQGNFRSSAGSTEMRQDSSWSKDASDLEVFYTKENIKVAVYNADILNLPVDCIVNSANDRMQHEGGVAKVIADAAGPQLIQEGNVIMRKMGRIHVGSQVTTTAGRLPYKCVIHTVGPCWSDYQPHNLEKVKDCENDLYAAIYGCFIKAEKNGISTIGLPAVSSGIYAVPEEMCAVQYAKAVLDYSRKSRQGHALKEIHFIDKLPHLVNLMQDTFRRMIVSGNVPSYNIQNYVVSSSGYQRQQSKETGRKGRGNINVEVNDIHYETTKLKELSPLYYEQKVHGTKQFVFQVSSKPVVHIYEGDILKLTDVDAIVCPDDTKGNGKGIIALELEKELKHKKHKEIRFESKRRDLGDVVITRGKKTKFNVIVYVVIENDSPQKPDFTSTMKKSIDNILRKTNEFVKVKTIAIPLFGVEPGVLTEKSWAESFLEKFVPFCHEVKNPSLEEVHIITDFSSSSSYSALMKVFIEFADKLNNTSSDQKGKQPRLALSKVYRTYDYAQDPLSGQGYKSNIEKGDTDDSCTICLYPKSDPKYLPCGHSFCSECIDQMLKYKPLCAVCGKIMGTLTGDQPNDGRMCVKTSSMNLAGYEGYSCIEITYDFPVGKQGPDHPSPGKWYSQMTRIAYLPNTPEGTKVCKMLQLAFERRLVFTVSTLQTGIEGLTWNDIHHKTNPIPGAQNGFPDPDYLSRVKDELAAKGITEADLGKEQTEV